jgi:mersacidin/lichenicidin family type 2 lantibiotic
MSKVNIIRAWKDEAYRLSLSEAERAALPANPAGKIELSGSDLEQVVGGVADTTSVMIHMHCTSTMM